MQVGVLSDSQDFLCLNQCGVTRFMFCPVSEYFGNGTFLLVVGNFAMLQISELFLVLFCIFLQVLIIILPICLYDCAVCLCFKVCTEAKCQCALAASQGAIFSMSSFVLYEKH